MDPIGPILSVPSRRQNAIGANASHNEPRPVPFPGSDRGTAGARHPRPMASCRVLTPSVTPADTLYGGPGDNTAHIDQGLDQIPNNDIQTILYT
jgi:hypothetical protein